MPPPASLRNLRSDPGIIGTIKPGSVSPSARDKAFAKPVRSYSAGPGMGAQPVARRERLPREHTPDLIKRDIAARWLDNQA